MAEVKVLALYPHPEAWQRYGELMGHLHLIEDLSKADIEYDPKLERCLMKVLVATAIELGLETNEGES